MVHVPGDALEAGLAGRVVRVQRLLHHLLLLLLHHLVRWTICMQRGVLQSRVSSVLAIRRRHLLVRAAALRRRQLYAR